MQTFVLAPEVRKKSEVVHVFLKTLKKFFWWLRLRHTEVSWARGQMGAAAASLHHSDSNSGSEPPLRPIPHLMAMLDSYE